MVHIVATTMIELIHVRLERLEGLVSGCIIYFTTEKCDSKHSDDADESETTDGESDDDRD